MVDMKKVSLGLAIGIVFALFIGFFIDALYAQPDYEEYCHDMYGSIYPQKYSEPQNCTSVYDAAAEKKCYDQKGYVRYTYDEKGCEKEQLCELCSKNFNDDLKNYNKNLFYITFPLGLLATILGLYLPLTVEAIASGFMLGGIFTLIQITVRVFGDLGKIGRVVLLGLELVILLWIGYKKVSDVKPRSALNNAPMQKKKK